jgi:hypothetical protein
MKKISNKDGVLVASRASVPELEGGVLIAKSVLWSNWAVYTGAAGIWGWGLAGGWGSI